MILAIGGFFLLYVVSELGAALKIRPFWSERPEGGCYNVVEIPHEEEEEDPYDNYEFPVEETDKVSDWEMGAMVRTINYMTGPKEYYSSYNDFHSVYYLLAEVIWNRVESQEFPNSVEEVLQQPGQFPEVPEEYRYSNGRETKLAIVSVLENTEIKDFKPLYAIPCTEVPEISGDNVVIQKENGTFIVFCEEFPTID